MKRGRGNSRTYNNKNDRIKDNKNGNKRTNPLNAKGEVSRCVICGSKFHWKQNCPDADHDI